MRNARVVQVAALSFAILISGCDDKKTDGTAAIPSSEVTGSDASSAAAAALSGDDKAFITDATQGGLLEIALANVAQTNGSTPDAKAFAVTMVSDHAKINDQLSVLAGKKGMTVPAQLDSSKKSKVDDFSKLSGAALDKKYARDMVEDHEDDVKDFQKASTSLSDPDLKAFAASTLPTLQHHLDMAKAMDAKVNGDGGAMMPMDGGHPMMGHPGMHH